MPIQRPESSRSERTPRRGAGPPFRRGAVVAALALLAVSSLAAMAVEQLGARLHADVPPGWPANGCLRAAVAPMVAQIVPGQASLCITDSGMRGTVYLERVEPNVRYAEWIAYFESPSLCAFGALTYQVDAFHQPCTLTDLDGPQPLGFAREVARSTADAQGDLHIAGPLPAIDMRPHAQAWLLVSRPSWSPQPHVVESAQDNPSKPIVRAIFDLP